MNRRLQEVKNSLGKTFDAILVSSIPNIIYLTNFNGFSDKEREAYLLLTKNAHYVFTDGRYAEVASKIKGFKLVRTSPNRNFGQALKGIVGKEKIKKLEIDERDIKVSETLQIKKVVKTCPDKNLIEKLRATKDTTEIKNIQAACRLGDQVFEYILSEIKLGITEKEIANKIEIFILQKGTQISFKPVVAFAANSSSPHHVAGNTKLKKNNIVLLDFGVKLNNYCSDMTRVVFFKKATDKQKKIYQTVLEAQLKAVEFIK
ncbi:MAG: Xaa-Pro peptidase family protein, partial [Candidatus Levyibacteriota bacterium]